MRIAHLTWSMGIGGIQTMLVDIVNEQLKAGNEVGIFVIDTEVSETVMNKLDSHANVFFMGRACVTRSLWPFIKLNWLLFKYNPDIIHSHAGKLSKIIFTKVPMVVTVHNMKRNPRDYDKYRKKFAISEAVKNDWISKGCSGLTVIENGIPCNKIKYKTAFNRNDTIHVVQVSRIFFPQKRQDLVVLALAKLRDCKEADSKLRGKNIIIHFVGDGKDLPKLKELVANLKLEENVVFEGFRDRAWVYEHLCDFDLFLQPSDYEGFGLTVAEACAAKIPVLVSDVDGPLEIIGNGKFGMFFKHGDVKDLCAKIIDFMEYGCDTTIVEKAYQNTIKKYDIKRTALRYIEEYQELINNIQ